MGSLSGKFILRLLFLVLIKSNVVHSTIDGQKGWNLVQLEIPKDKWKLLETHYELGGLDIYDLKNVKGGKIKITAAASRDAEKALDTAKINYEVMQTLAKAVEEDKEGQTRRTGLVQNEITFESNLLYDDIAKVLNNLKEKSTDYREISVVTIGKTVQKRDLKMVKIEHPGARNIMFFDAGIHAREWLSVMTAMYLITSLIKASKTDGINKMNWYIVPVVNPDGYIYSHGEHKRMHRKNTDFALCPGNCTCGVDLNRNYGYKWGVDELGKNPCSVIYRGTKPFSEPESKAMSETMERYADDIKLFITLHSYGCDFLYPWGYEEKNCTDYKDLIEAADVAIKVMNKYKNKRQKTCMYTVDNAGKLPGAGGADDYAKGSLKIKYVYTVEVQPGGNTGFDPEDSKIRLFVEQNCDGLKAISKYVNEKYALPGTGYRRDIEDENHDAGHQSGSVRVSSQMSFSMSAIVLFLIYKV